MKTLQMTAIGLLMLCVPGVALAISPPAAPAAHFPTAAPAQPTRGPAVNGMIAPTPALMTQRGQNQAVRIAAKEEGTPLTHVQVTLQEKPTAFGGWVGFNATGKNKQGQSVALSGNINPIKGSVSEDPGESRSHVSGLQVVSVSATKGGSTPALSAPALKEVKSLGGWINKQLNTQDTGIDQLEVAGTDIKATQAPAGAPSSVVALFDKLSAQSQAPGTSAQLYQFKPQFQGLSGKIQGSVWGIQSTNPKEQTMVLINSDGKEMGTGTMATNGANFKWTAMK